MDYETLNPGIRRTVEMLNRAGFETCDSGDGETHEYGCDRPYPYVVIMVPAFALVEETGRLVDILEDIGITVDPISEDDCGVHIQATFDPGIKDGRYAAMIDLQGVHDRMLPGGK